VGKPSAGTAKNGDPEDKAGPEGGIRLLDSETGKLRPLTEDKRDHFAVGAPQSVAVAFLREGALYVIDSVDAEKVAPRRVADDVKPLPPVWSPDGTRLAYWVAAETPTARVVAATGGEPRTLELPKETMPASGLLWSPDGTQLGFLKRQVEKEAERQLLYVIGIADGKERRLTTALSDHREATWAS